MAIKPKRVKQTGGQKLQSPVLDADNYPARLVQVIDLGLQKNFFDPEKINHEVMLTYELTTEFCLDEKGEPVEDKPRWLSETINIIDLPVGMSVEELYQDQYRGKSKMVLRARAFDPKGQLDFDFTEMVGMPCAVTVVKKKKKSDGKDKNEVGGVTSPMKGLQIAELVNPPKVFTLDEPDMEVFESSPDFVKDKIKANLEFAGSPLEALLNGEKPAKKQEKAPEPQEKPEPQVDEDEGDDDDKPW